MADLSSTFVAARELDPTGDLEALRNRALRREELAIARDFHGGVMWPYAAATVIGFAVWLSFFPLAILGELNLALAFVVSTVFAVAGYVTGHEAVHSNIARPGEKLHWLNELTGHLGTVIVAMPFSASRLTHLEHHHHCNDPDKDPDFGDIAPNLWAAIWKSWYNRQPRVEGSAFYYRRVLTALGTPAAARAMKQMMLWQLVFLGVLFAMAWSGYAIEAALIWWLPRQVGLTCIRVILSWAPHHPRAGKIGRYQNTRVFKSPIGHVLSGGAQYHLIHHLYPGIPNHRTKAAYRALKPVLRARGVDVSKL